MPITAKPLTPAAPAKRAIESTGPSRLYLVIPIAPNEERTVLLETITDQERLRALLPEHSFDALRVLPPTANLRVAAYIVLGVDIQVSPPGVRAGEVFQKAKDLAAVLQVSPAALSGALNYSRIKNPEAALATGTIKGVTFARLHDYNEQINRDAKV